MVLAAGLPLASFGREKKGFREYLFRKDVYKRQALYVAKINGKQVYELVENYLADADENFYVTNKYELPIASGMKMIVSQEESGFSLKDLTVNDKKIDKEKEYSILLTDTTMSVLKKTNPKCEIEQLKDTTLSSAWTEAMSNGQQPSAPEDYIEVEQ